MSKSFIVLPPPRITSQVSLETAIAHRCPVGPYAEEQLTREQIGQLLWAAHTTDSVHKRKSTNGSTWLILYVCWADAVWRYHLHEHCLTRHLKGDVRRELADAAWNRWFIAQAPCVFVIATAPKRGKRSRYGDSWRLWYPSVEAGRAAERMLLQSAALGLAGFVVSEFDSVEVKHRLVLSCQEEPLCLVPVGWGDQG